MQSIFCSRTFLTRFNTYDKYIVQISDFRPFGRAWHVQESIGFGRRGLLNFDHRAVVIQYVCNINYNIFFASPSRQIISIARVISPPNRPNKFVETDFINKNVVHSNHPVLRSNQRVIFARKSMNTSILYSVFDLTGFKIISKPITSLRYIFLLCYKSWGIVLNSVAARFLINLQMWTADYWKGDSLCCVSMESDFRRLIWWLKKWHKNIKFA